MLLFKRENRFVLDSSSIIDGRVLNLFEKNFFEGKIIIPILVHSIVKRYTQGKINRVFNVLKQNNPIEFVKNKGNGLIEGNCVLKIAERKKAKVITASDEVCRLGKFHPGVRIIDVRDLHRALIPIFTPDKLISVRIVKRGLHTHEGIGYIEGVKIIVEHGAKFINQTVHARVTTMLITSTGNLVFSILENKKGATPIISM